MGVQRLRWLVLVVAWLWVGSAQAQWRRSTGPVAAPPLSLVDPGDALAVEHHPAALAFLDAWSLVYLHADAGDQAAFPERGDGFYAASPIALGLAAGASGHSLRPEDERDHGLFSMAFAYRTGRELSFGSAIRFVGAAGARDRVTMLDASIAYRPSSALGFALLLRDVNGAVDLHAADVDLPASAVLAAALRPYRNDTLTLEAAFAADTEGRVGVRAGFGLRVPEVGRVMVAYEGEDLAADDRDHRVTAGLAIDWGAVGVEGGVLAGDRFDDATGWYVAGRYGGAERRGLPTRRYVVDLEVRGAVDARRLLGLAMRLDRALHDDRVAGVLLRLRRTGIGTAYAQELRLLIGALEEAGKPVVCHLDAASGAELYACGAASHRYLDPAGGVRLMGPSASSLFLGPALRRAGVRADFIRIGDYKSAAERLTNGGSTEPAIEARDALYDDVIVRLRDDLARDLDIEPAAAMRIIDQGPYVTHEAVDAGIVDGLADDLDMGDVLEEVLGRSFPRRTSEPLRAARAWGVSSRIGVVMVDGNIVDGDNTDIPFVGIHTSGGRTVARAVEAMARDRTIAAIVLRVDSAGGSALASDQVWRAVRRAARRKPVIASMGAIAASGGYYVACAADEIWADPTTITGSIGIFFGKVDFEPLAEQWGIGVEHVRRGRRAGAESTWRGFTGDERLVLADKIRIWYRLFLHRVATGRGMEVEAVDAVARGRIWSGDAALARGLVDRLGGFHSAVARAREIANLPTDAEVVVLPSRPESLLDYVLADDAGSSRAAAPDAEAPILVPAALRPLTSTLYTIATAPEGVPMALSPPVEVR